MDKLDVIKKVKERIAEQLSINIEDVTEKMSFDELGLDSLDIVELVMQLEQEYDIEIEDESGIKTVGDIIKYIEDAI